MFVYVVNMCYEVVKKDNKKYFVIQFYGECWVLKNDFYKIYGLFINCWNGVGRDFDNYVYEIIL